MKYIKTVFEITNPEYALFYTIAGVGVFISIALSPVWFPFYLLGRTYLYVVDKEWKDKK